MATPECDNPHLADELLIVRHSGEIPEVALQGALHFLTADPDGPALALTEKDIRALKGMVVERYREITMRDLNPANRNLPLYRGVARAAVNWRRLAKFCARENLAVADLRRETREALLAIIHQEAEEVARLARPPAINCPAAELQRFAAEVGLRDTELPPGWQTLCQSAPAE